MIAYATGTATTGGAGGGIIQIILIIAMFGLMMFFMTRSQKKREKEMKELRNNLEVGDNVVTECGITGKVISVKDPETITLETGADKTRLKFKRWAVIAKEEEK